ncbi:ABC transporter ATP-binding protein [Reinekea sp.]|uniref:ABC transporter ATP-binding protein n=1 Tax=Reinekea sp. TaxID=1970455 RepID=UPI002A8051B9|nr:ATP-binding cassette domain-containing protein [Reinekea sp.]
MAEIELVNVKKSFGTVDVIKGINLQADHGEFVVFVGPSGCGKSTLLRMICGLETISSGQLLIGNEDMSDVEASGRGTAMMIQSQGLYPHMTVAQNMSFGLRMANMLAQEVDARVNRAADILRVRDLLDRKPKDLSGGQRQRVAIGCAILREPKVFLFDEPLSNLDAQLRVQMRIELTKLHHNIGATMIYVTHDQVEAMAMADKIVVLRDGLVEQIGSPLELYLSPDNKFVGGFMGSPEMNFLNAEVHTSDGVSANLSVTGAPDYLLSIPLRAGKTVAQGQKVTIGIRPEHLLGTVDGSGIDVQVEVSEDLDGSTYLFGKLKDGQKMIVKFECDTPLHSGSTVSAQLKEIYCHLFDLDGIALSRAAGNIRNKDAVV